MDQKSFWPAYRANWQYSSTSGIKTVKIIGLFLICHKVNLPIVIVIEERRWSEDK